MTPAEPVRVAARFLPVEHACGHVRGWGGPLVNRAARRAGEDRRIAAWVRAAGRYPCAWCGGPDGTAEAPAEGECAIVEGLPGRFLVLAEAREGVATVTLADGAEPWTWHRSD